METMWKRVLSFVLVLALLVPNFATIASATEGEDVPAVEVISEDVLSEAEEETPEEEPEIIPEESEEVVPEESEEVIPEESEEVIPEESEEVVPEESEEVVPEESEEVVPEESEEVIPEESEEVVPEESEEVIPEEYEEVIIGDEITVEETIEVVDAVVEEEPEELETVVLEISLDTVEETLDDGLTSDELLEGYIQQVLMDEDTSAYGVQGYNKLDVYGKFLYDQMLTTVAAVAADGNNGNTRTTITSEALENAGFTVVWTLEELGLDALLDEDGNLTDEANVALSEKLDILLPSLEVVSALQTDHPYAMYWWGKGVAKGCDSSLLVYKNSAGEIVKVGFTGVFVELNAAAQYSEKDADENATGVLDSSTIADLQTTLATVKTNAENIVESFSDRESYTDFNRLSNYKKAICALTGYDFNAPGTYGTDSNPWQLLWVFDGDENTNVVCEGYSKAFQYLYDLTFKKGYFDGDVYCYLASGEMDGGAHMWNVVDFYGKSYLVDVTNSDPTMGDDKVAIGADGELFMVGGNGSVEDGYTYTFYADTENETHILYEYNEDIVDTYGSALRLSTSNPDQAKLEAALMHCVYLTETSEDVWYWVLENDVTITDDMTINATLHVGAGEGDQVSTGSVTLTVAEGATLTVPKGVEFENNDTIVIEAGGSVTGTGTYSGNEIEVREGGSLTLTYANAETEVKTGRLGFMWLEWNEESQQLYVPEGRQPDYNMISAPEQIHAGAFCYYDADENLVYVPYSDLVSGNEGAVRLEEAPGGNAEEAIDGKITRVFSEGNLGESSVISHTAEDGTVYQLLIRLQMQEDGFYSEAKRDEDCYITGYQMHPLRKENAFYFNFSREGWHIDGTPALTVSCGDEWQSHATITQVANSDIYKITLSDELVNSNAFGDGFSVILTYDITNGTAREDDRESGIWCYFGNLWDGSDTAFRINGQGMAYFPQYDGFMGPDEENDGRLVKRTLPEGVTYDYSTRTLYLNGANLTNLEASGEEIPVLNVHLTGENSITAEGDKHAIALHDGAQLNILGGGSLMVSAPEFENNPIIGIWGRSSLTIGDNADVTLECRDEEVLGWHMCGISGDGTGSLIMEGGTLTTVNGDDENSGNYCGVCTGVGYITLRGGTLNVNRLERTWENVPNSLTMEGGTLNAGHVILRQAMELRSGELHTDFLEHYSYLAIGGGQENQTMTVNVSREDGPAVDSYSLLHLMPGANATFTNTNPNDENDVGLFTRLGVIVNGGTLNASGRTGIYFETDQGAQFEMSGGTVNASGLWGIHVKGGRVNLMRGTLNATGEGDANQNQDGILHVFGMLLDEGATMIVNGGNGHTFTAVDKDDNTPEGMQDAMVKALGIRNGGSLVMNGGAINLDGEMALYNVTGEEAAAISGSYAITDENGNALQLQVQELGGFNVFSISDGTGGYASKAKLTAAWADAGITWKVEDGVLTISGNGALADFAVDETYIPETPWHGDAEIDINSITSVVVEEGITRIGSNAFTAMPNVQTISLPASLQELVPGFAFRNPASFTIADDGKYYVHNNVIIDGGTDTESARVLRASNSFTGTFTPPDGVTVIGDSAFEGITGLESIALDGITEIGYGAFAGSGLTSVEIPDGITVIRSGAFNGLTLDSLTLPVSLEAVESNAFDTIKINQLHYSGSASQWANVNIAAYNAALQAAIPTMTFGDTMEKDREEDAYLSIFHLENHGNGWLEPEEKWFEEELGMSIGDTYYGMVYLNTWTGTETAGGWLRTPLKASELRVVNVENYAGLELLSLQEAHEYIANNEANGDYFLRLSINGNWNSRGAITYSYGEETLQIPVGVHRAGFGYYDDSIVYGNDGNIAENLENEEHKNNAWTEHVDYDPFADVGATFYALVDYDWVATGLPYILNEEFQDQTWAKVSYWNGTEFKPADSWTEGTTAKLFKIELTPGAPANPFRLDMELPVARVENGELINNGDVWGRGIDVGVATGGQDNPWYACFDINDVHYDIFEKGIQAHQHDNSWTLTELPYGISYDPDSNTITLDNINAQDVHSLRAQYRWYDEHSGDSGTNFPNENLTINLVGDNTMYGNLDTVLAFSDDLNVTITSDEGGTLSVEAFNKPDNFNEHGDPYAFNTVNVERGASLTIAGNASVTAEIGGQGYWGWDNPAHASAIWMNGNNLTVKDSASLTTIVPGGARQINGWWEDGELVGGYGEINDFGQLLVEDNATVNTGRIDIPEIWEYDEESEQDYFTGHGGALIINGGTVNVTPSSNYNVWEEDGETRTEYWFAGIHSNRGTIQVNGGTLIISAPTYVADQNNSFNAINMDGGSMTVNGGRVLVNHILCEDGSIESVDNSIYNACGLRLGYGDNDRRTYPANFIMNGGELYLWANGEDSRSIGHDAHSGTFTVNGGKIKANGDAHFDGKLKQTGGELKIASGELNFNNVVQAQGGVMNLDPSWQIRLNDTAKFTISDDAEVYTHAWNADPEGWYEHFTVDPYASMEVKGGKLEINFSNFDVGFCMKGEYLQTGGQVSVLSNTAPEDHVDSNVEVAFVATGLVELQGGELNANAEVGYVQDYEFGAPEYDVAENPNGRLEVSGGTLNAIGTFSGMEICAPVELTGGSVNAEVTTDDEAAAAVYAWDNSGKASLTITGGEHTFTAPLDGGNAYMSKGLLVDDAPVVVEAADGETVTVEIQAECTVAEFTWDTTQSRMSGNKLIFTSLMDGANERKLQYRDVTEELGIEDDVTVYMQYLDENQGSGDIVYNTHVRIGDEPLVIKPNEAAIGQTQYPTLEDAINAANDGDFINIIAPVTEKPNVTINKALTILNFYNYPLWEEDAAAALNQIVDTNYSVTVNSVIYYINPAPAGQTNVAQIGTTKYTTVKAALEAAVAGDVVTMIADSDESGKDLIVNKGVTLDLDCYDLAARSLIGSNGAFVYGDTYDTANDYSKLKAETLRLGEKAFFDDKTTTTGYHIIPIYQSEEGHYVFGHVNVYTAGSTAGLRIDREKKEIYFVFGQQLRKIIREGLVKGQYTREGQKFRVALEITWRNENGVYNQEYVYKDEFVQYCAENTSRYYTYTLSGYDKLGLDDKLGENTTAMDTLEIKPMIIADSGVVVWSKVYTANDSKI